MKKCLRVSALSLALLIFLGLPFVGQSFASVPAVKPKLTLSPISKRIQADLAQFTQSKKTDFADLLSQWESIPKESLRTTLLSLAKDKTKTDTHRYVAVLGLTKLMGQAGASEIRPLLKDSNWMVRSAVLKSIAITKDQASGDAVIERLEKDPALVIRSQAVETLASLQCEGAREALVKAAFSPQNYRPKGYGYKRGKADFVPIQALKALREMKAKSVTTRILPLLAEARDPKLRAHALYTIETLEGKTLKKNAKFNERAIAWSQALSQRR